MNNFPEYGEAIFEPSSFAPDDAPASGHARKFLLGQLDNIVIFLFMGLFLSLRGLFDLFYTPFTNEIGKGYKENYDFFLCVLLALLCSKIIIFWSQSGHMAE